jgi:hypothetical protein
MFSQFESMDVGLIVTISILATIVGIAVICALVYFCCGLYACFVINSLSDNRRGNCCC